MEANNQVIFAETIKYDGQVIFVEPVCDFFEIDHDYQFRVINGDRVLSKHKTKKASPQIFKDRRERVALTRIGFVRWIQLINPQQVKADFIDRLSFFQEFVTDVVYGSLEKKEVAIVHNERLVKLKKLYSRVGLEIQSEEKLVKKYIDEHLSKQLMLL